jgi:hypothetical protein
LSIIVNSRRITFGWGQMNACCIGVPHPKRLFLTSAGDITLKTFKTLETSGSAA